MVEQTYEVLVNGVIHIMTKKEYVEYLIHKYAPNKRIMYWNKEKSDKFGFVDYRGFHINIKVFEFFNIQELHQFALHEIAHELYKGYGNASHSQGYKKFAESLGVKKENTDFILGGIPYWKVKKVLGWDKKNTKVGYNGTN